MPKRRRLLTPMKKRPIMVKKGEPVVYEVSSPRGRLKGALLDVLEPNENESEASAEETPVKNERQVYNEGESSDDDDIYRRHQSPQRQSYVLKLFDRSVDLSQFEENSPLYPICRAWMINQPKANYRKIGRNKAKPPLASLESVELPGPEGPPISRIPSLLADQLSSSKDNINLNYREAPPPSTELLLQRHLTRWTNVRRHWLAHSARVEERYDATQQLLNKINNSM